MQDFEFFLRENWWPVNLNIIISANRPAESAKSAIFYEKPKNFVKNGQKVEVNNLAGNGRFYQILLKTCFLVSWDLMWWILDHCTIFINFGSVLKFGEKIENFCKIKLREIFSAVNPLEKIQKNFFFKFEIWWICFVLIKRWEVLYLTR